jgi:hypothetical protein
MKLILLIAAVTAVNTFIIINIINAALMGIPLPKIRFGRAKAKAYISPLPDTELVDGSYFERQGEVECAGFSSAFVLRHHGIPARGYEIYESVPNKFGSGFVYPKGITGYFRGAGHSAVMRTGSLSALKDRISAGEPTIVMIRSREGGSALHFVCVTGYDEEYIYLAETVGEFINDSGEYHTRRIPKAQFKRLWNTSMLKMPLYRNIFYEVTLRAEPHEK